MDEKQHSFTFLPPLMVDWSVMKRPGPGPGPIMEFLFIIKKFNLFENDPLVMKNVFILIFYC